jgi:hypothetical protein
VDKFRGVIDFEKHDPLFTEVFGHSFKLCE